MGVDLIDIPCGYCGKVNKSRMGKRPKLFCKGVTCRKKHKQWLVGHRRVIADAVTPCASCGKLIGQYKLINPDRQKLGCSPSCSAQAINNKVKPVFWEDGPNFMNLTKVGSPPSATLGEMLSFRATHCQRLYANLRSPCKFYTDCLDQEMVKKGSGFPPDCGRYQPQTSSPPPPGGGGRGGFGNYINSLFRD